MKIKEDYQTVLTLLWREYQRVTSSQKKTTLQRRIEFLWNTATLSILQTLLLNTNRKSNVLESSDRLDGISRKLATSYIGQGREDRAYLIVISWRPLTKTQFLIVHFVVSKIYHQKKCCFEKDTFLACMRSHIWKDWFIHPFLKVCVHNFRCTFRKRVCCGHPQLCGRHSRTQKASGNFRFDSLSLWKMKHHKLQRLKKKVYTNSHLAKIAVVLHAVSGLYFQFTLVLSIFNYLLHCATCIELFCSHMLYARIKMHFVIKVNFWGLIPFNSFLLCCEKTYSITNPVQMKCTYGAAKSEKNLYP